MEVPKIGTLKYTRLKKNLKKYIKKSKNIFKNQLTLVEKNEIWI